MQFWEANLQTLFNILLSPLGVALLFAFAAVAVLSISNRALQLTILTAMFVSLTTSPAAQIHEGQLYQAIAQPFEWIRQNCRVVTVLCLCTLLPAILLQPAGGLQQRGGGPAVALLLFHLLVTCIVSLRTGVDAKEFLTLMSLGLIWLAVSGFPSFTLDAWLGRWRPFVYALVCFVLINWLLVAIGSSGLISGRRFQGFTSNPQFTGQMAALAILVIAAGIAEPALRSKLRLPFWILWVLAGLAAGILAWTGSRGGAVIAAVGLLVLFGPRLGRMLFFLAPTAVAAWLVLENFGQFDTSSAASGLSRILRFENSRAVVWQSLWGEFLKSPLWGRGAEMESDFSESSYLLVAARFGLVGLVPLLLALAMGFISVLRVSVLDIPSMQIGRRLPLAIFSATVTGAFAEAYLLGRYQLTLAAVFVSLVMASRLRSLVVEAARYEDLERPPIQVRWA